MIAPFFYTIVQTRSEYLWDEALQCHLAVLRALYENLCYGHDLMMNDGVDFPTVKKFIPKC